jgi:hypothetical protein
MGLELGRNCQDRAPGFYEPTRKQLMQIYFGASDFYGLKHRLSFVKKVSRKDRMRGWQEARAVFSYSEQCSLDRIVGFCRVQYQKFWGNLNQCCEEKQIGPHREFSKNKIEVSNICEDADEMKASG